MTVPERDQLRERVAAGLATGEERDRLASLLARAIRDRNDVELESIEALIGELRTLASAGSDRTSCTDALAGALLDAQIRAFERGDAADAWRRLDEIRARLHHGGTPDLLHDRLAAALYNMVRGGELLGDVPMRLAALQELRTRAYGDPSAAACRVALAELLADGIARAARHDDGPRALSRCAELQRLRELDPNGVAVCREYARGLCELLASNVAPLEGDASAQLRMLGHLRTLAAEFELASGDPIRIYLAEALVILHAHALREQDPSVAAALREELRTLARTLAEQAGRTRARTRTAVIRELGMTLHDAAVASEASGDARLAGDALSELRVLVEQHDTDVELRGQLMSVLYRVHHGALERADDEAAERLQIEADALLTRDDALSPDDEADAAMRSGLLGRQAGQARQAREARQGARRTARLRAELRLDHLRMLLATHARAGDCGDWVRAELLLTQARASIERDPTALEMIELFGQMLVNAHVDAGVPRKSSGETEPMSERQARTRALLSELRDLADARPHSAALQLHHATALFNAHVDAGRRHALHEADRLLGELEHLHAQHGELLELRRRLAMVLVNHHGDLLEREDFARAVPLLDRLRALVRSPDADDQLRVQLAMAVGNSLSHLEDPVSDIQGQRMIGELRVLAGHPDASDTLRALVLDELSELFAPRQ